MITLINKPMRNGKTFDLAHIIKNCGGILITFSYQNVKRLENEYAWLKGKVFTWQDIEKIRGRSEDIYVDDVDMFLEHYFGYKLKAVSASMKIEK